MRIRIPHAFAVAFEFAFTELPFLFNLRTAAAAAPLPGAAATAEQPALAIVDAAGRVVATMPRRRAGEGPARPPAELTDRAAGAAMLELPAMELREGEGVRAFHARVLAHVTANRSTMRQVPALLPEDLRLAG